MPTSLRLLLSAAGFTDVHIDEESHAAAYVVTATVPHETSSSSHPEPVEACATMTAAADTAAHVAEARALAAYWSSASEAVQAFERDVARGRKSAIYGSGFYGVFIASRLADRSNLAYFLDRNPHQQTKRIFDRPVLAPGEIGDDVDVVYAGLNPAQARAIVAGVGPLHRRPRATFFL